MIEEEIRGMKEFEKYTHVYMLTSGIRIITYTPDERRFYDPIVIAENTKNGLTYQFSRWTPFNHNTYIRLNPDQIICSYKPNVSLILAYQSIVQYHRAIIDEENDFVLMKLMMESEIQIQNALSEEKTNEKPNHETNKKVH